MSLLVAAAVALAALLFFRARARRASRPEVAHETTPALDAFVREALEHELAGPVLGLRGASPEERRPLQKTLAGEPDPDVVAKIEDEVKSVELEFVRYSHESDAEVTVRVRYEDQRAGETSRRVSWSDVPPSVREDFERRGATRAFRVWTFPWQRVRAL